MTESLRYLRQFLRGFQNQATSTRVFFPDANELGVALRGAKMDPNAGSRGVEPVFEGAKFKLGYLTKPNPWLDLGLTIGKVNPAEQVRGEAWRCGRACGDRAAGAPSGPPSGDGCRLELATMAVLQATLIPRLPTPLRRSSPPTSCWWPRTPTST